MRHELSCGVDQHRLAIRAPLNLLCHFERQGSLVGAHEIKIGFVNQMDPITAGLCDVAAWLGRGVGRLARGGVNDITSYLFISWRTRTAKKSIKIDWFSQLAISKRARQSFSKSFIF